MKCNPVLAAAVFAAFTAGATSGALAADEPKQKQDISGVGTPEPRKQPFAKLDNDDSGFLEHDEAAADPDAASRFHALDKDDDQKVSRAEYDAWAKGGAAAAGATASTREAVTIKLQPQSGSGESGTATLTPQGEDKTKVVLEIAGAPSGLAQPAHIHDGTCAQLDPKPKYGLESVENGSSTTIVPAGIDKLLSGKSAINVHKSGDAIKTYVACGNLEKG